MGWLEGGSFLILLFIAMPLKYYWDMPEYVSVVGMAHGILFILYCILIALVMGKYQWELWKAGVLFVAAFVPFGPFVVDYKILDWTKGPDA